MRVRLAARIREAAALVLFASIHMSWGETVSNAHLIHAPIHTVSIPDQNLLRKEALTWWPSLLSHSVRVALFQPIETLTSEHLRLLRQTALPLRITKDTKTWADTRLGIHSLRPPERAIVSGILLQTDILDGVLTTKDPSRADVLREQRRLRPLRSEQERIFGDRRDEIFFYCFDALHDLSNLQTALGSAAPTFDPTTGIKSLRDAERWLQTHLERLAERARHLP